MSALLSAGCFEASVTMATLLLCLSWARTVPADDTATANAKTKQIRNILRLLRIKWDDAMTVFPEIFAGLR
jgi:hypothetical protein